MHAARRPPLLVICSALTLAACADDTKTPDATAATDTAVATDTSAPPDATPDGDDGDVTPTNPWGAPLDPASPWPKFRRDLAQTGRSDVVPTADEAVALWVARASSRRP